MTFSKKAGANTPTQGTTDIDPDARSAWNQHQFDVFKAKAKELPNGKTRKEKTLIGKVNFIMDLGYPPAPDSEWDTKCALPADGEEYSQEELDWKEKNPSHDFIWKTEYEDGKKKTVRKQTSPSYPAQEYGVAVDFPQIMVDYSKHYNSDSDEEDLRPLRISLNGSFHQRFPKNIVFDGSYKPVGSNNLLYKICSAADLEKELIESEYDIATLAGAVCNFNVRCDLNVGDDGVTYVNWTANKPSGIEDIETPTGDFSAEDQIEAAFKDKNVADFVGILLDDMEYTDEMLSMLGNDTFGYVKHASESKKFVLEGVSKKTGNPYSFEKGVEYSETDFAKAWAKFKGESAPVASTEKRSSESNTNTQEKSKPSEKAVEKKESKPKDPMEPPIDFYDDTL